MLYQNLESQLRLKLILVISEFLKSMTPPYQPQKISLCLANYRHQFPKKHKIQKHEDKIVLTIFGQLWLML